MEIEKAIEIGGDDEMTMDEMWEGMCGLLSLLDNIELALRDDDIDEAYDLVMTRFDVLESMGFETNILGVFDSREEAKAFVEQMRYPTLN
jgi:hypothetical protein